MRVFKLLLLLGAFIASLPFASRIGFWVTGDLHSGGPLFGFPIIFVAAALLGVLLFWGDLVELWKKKKLADKEVEDRLPAPRQVELVRRLVCQQHLSVPERQELSGGAASARLVVKAIMEIVKEHGYYPSHARPGHPYAGGIIEQVGPSEAVVHWQTEVSLGQHAVIETERFATVKVAAETFVRREWGGGIDGVPVVWNV